MNKSVGNGVLHELALKYVMIFLALDFGFEWMSL